MSFTCTFLAFVLLVVGSSYSKKIPPYITLCHRNDPELNKCMINAVEQLKPHLIDGVPELLIPSLNPLRLPAAGLDSGNNFRAAFKNIEVHHVNDFKIENLDINLKKIHIDLSLSFPKLRIRSQYTIDGKLLVLQLQGQGPADGNFTDVTARAVFDGQLVNKKGKDHIALSLDKLDLKLGKPVFRFDNILGDNEELNDQTNKIINENIVDILDELRPVIDKTVVEFVLGIVNRIFNRFSFDELFPK